MKLTFPKNERITYKKDIERLFSSGKQKFIYPFKILWFEDPDDKKQVKVLISVSKKIFKKAVDRNLLKRRIKESYRLNKHLLYDNPDFDNKKLSLAFIYVAKEKIDFFKIDLKMKEILKTLINTAILNNKNKQL